jgi:hypothetical protein
MTTFAEFRLDDTNVYPKQQQPTIVEINGLFRCDSPRVAIAMSIDKTPQKKKESVCAEATAKVGDTHIFR